VLITSNPAFLEEPELRGSTPTAETKPTMPVRWTDDFASLWQVLETD
jgi:hypothetical protein